MFASLVASSKQGPGVAADRTRRSVRYRRAYVVVLASCNVTIVSFVHASMIVPLL
jgi:hypothetical protein